MVFTNMNTELDFFKGIFDLGDAFRSILSKRDLSIDRSQWISLRGVLLHVLRLDSCWKSHLSIVS